MTELIKKTIPANAVRRTVGVKLKKSLSYLFAKEVKLQSAEIINAEKQLERIKGSFAVRADR